MCPEGHGWSAGTFGAARAGTCAGIRATGNLTLARKLADHDVWRPVPSPYLKQQGGERGMGCDEEAAGSWWREHTE